MPHMNEPSTIMCMDDIKRERERERETCVRVISVLKHILPLPSYVIGGGLYCLLCVQQLTLIQKQIVVMLGSILCVRVYVVIVIVYS